MRNITGLPRAVLTLEGMRTYTEAFRVPEFTTLFATFAIRVAAWTISGLALAIYVFAATGSPLLAALAMFGPSLSMIVGGSVLLSAADRLPPRAVLSWMAVLTGLGTAAQSIPGLSLWGIFAITLTLGLVAPLSLGAQSGLLAEIMPADGYVLGQAMLNMANGIIQVCGFALGGVLLTVVTPRGALLAAAALWLLVAAGTRWGLTARPPRVAGRPSLAQTWRSNRLLWSSVPRRYVFLALWIPNGLVVGCEALFVSYSPRHAGLMFAFTALGMLAGDTLVGRFIPASWRVRLAPWLRLLLALPYLVFALHPAFGIAVAAATLASAGYSASLMLQERLVKLTPDELNGHALGLQSTGMGVMQGVGAAIAGAVATWTSPAAAMSVMALASITVTLLLAPGLRREPQAASLPEPVEHSGRLAGRPGPGA
ncbi:MAG TPA: MFS transporter [Trebonia sp.]